MPSRAGKKQRGTTDLTTLLEVLSHAKVDFVLVGGLAAVTQGAPVTTLDVDIVHSLQPANVDRLIALLESLDARYRGRGDVLRPSRADLLAGGHVLLMTRLGPLDVLGQIEHGKRFEDLVGDSITVELRGRAVRVLRLETLVALKRESKHEKDRAVLPTLEKTLARQLAKQPKR